MRDGQIERQFLRQFLQCRGRRGSFNRYCLVETLSLSDGKAISDYDLLCGISELESEMNEHPGDPMIALVGAIVLSLGNSGLLLLAYLLRGVESECE